MDTKEQLTYAAKACGIKIGGFGGMDFHPSYPCLCNGNGASWSPITDQADSDRMGTKLQMDVKWYKKAVLVEAKPLFSFAEYFSDHNDDENAALRIARLRCAAEIGKGMES